MQLTCKPQVVNISTSLDDAEKEPLRAEPTLTSVYQINSPVG